MNNNWPALAPDGWSNRAELILPDDRPSNVNNVSDYNLFFRSGDRAIPFFRGWGATTYSTIESWQEATGNDRNSILAEPRFVDLDRRDFRPTSGSPNIGHVQPHMSVRFDADGSLRPRSSSRTTGAYEAAGENDG